MRPIQICLNCDTNRALMSQRLCAKCGGDITLHRSLLKQYKKEQQQLQRSYIKRANEVKRGRYYYNYHESNRLRDRTKITNQLRHAELFINQKLDDVISIVLTEIKLDN